MYIRSTITYLVLLLLDILHPANYRALPLSLATLVSLLCWADETFQDTRVCVSWLAQSCCQFWSRGEHAEGDADDKKEEADTDTGPEYSS